MSEWMPIETAPKGREMLVYMEHGQVWVGIISEENGNCYMVKLDGRPIMLKPTHWMPLPEPPEQP